MKFTKIIAVLTFTVFLSIGFPSCIDCPVSWQVGAIDFLFTDAVSNDALTDTIATDSLKMVILLNPVYTDYVHQASPLYGTMNSAWAWSCGSEAVLEHAIETITITSNNVFNDLPSGTSINSKLGQRHYADIAEPLDSAFFMPIHEIIQQYFQAGASEYTGDIALTFLEKPDSTRHQFSIEITDSIGNVFTGQSNEIIWQ